jgi:hypothetical protein
MAVTIDGTNGINDIVLGSSTPAAATVTTFTSNGIDDNADALAITINSSENVGIGTTSPATLLHLGAGESVIRFGATSFGFDIGRNNSSGQFIQNATQASPYNKFVWQQGGIERMRIDSVGNLGIGTSAPTNSLDIRGTNGTGQLQVYKDSGGADNYVRLNLSNSTGSYFQLAANPSATDASSILNIYTSGSGGNIMSFLGNGKVGIGITPAALLHIKQAGNSTGNGIRVERSDTTAHSVMYMGGDDDLYIQNQANGDINWYTNTAAAMTLKADGKLGIGTSAPTSKLHVEGDSSANVVANLKGIHNGNVTTLRIERYASDGDGVTFFYGSTQKGYITVASGGTTYNTISDYRLKENVQPMSGALEKVSALKPVTYDWKDIGKTGQGFIAHELKAVVPECVTGEKDELDDEGEPRYQGVDTSRLVATLTAAIQEQQVIIESLKTRITALEG